MSPQLGCSVRSRRPSTSAGVPRNKLAESLHLVSIALNVYQLWHLQVGHSGSQRLLWHDKAGVVCQLSVDRDSLAQKDFLGSEGSWPCTGTGRTRGWVREGVQSTEAAGKSRDRWRCVA